MSDKIFFALYRCVGWPLLRGTFALLARFNSKIARGLELRDVVNGRAPWIKLLPPSPPTVWFHCASGEFEYAKPVITLIKERKPSLKVVVTFFSPTYADAVRKFKGVDWAIPLPWDTPRALGEFLNSYRPFALLIARTDVWPEMARETRRRGIASALFSATLTQNSRRTRGIGRWATRATLNKLDEIFCVTGEDATAFRSLGLLHAKVSQAGDTRYDQVLARLESPKAVRAEIFEAIRKSARDVLVCGSTWAEDEAVLIDSLAKLEGVCGVLVPHEPTREHLEELESRMRASGLVPVLYSSRDAASAVAVPFTCLIVDQVGILAELYLQADFAFVGGSFRKSVHSVMEPLAAGCVTFVGPLHTNNREAVAFQAEMITSATPSMASSLADPLSSSLAPPLALSFVTCVETSDALVSRIDALRAMPSVREQIRSAVRARTGSSEKLLKWLFTSVEE